MTDDVDPIKAEPQELEAKINKPSASAVRRLLPMLLSVVTLVGFASVIWYAYNTGIREGSEFAAPILRPDGPSKVAPANPGGQRIADQDKLVYGKIDKFTERRRTERLLPPPEKLLPVPIARKPPPVPASKLEVPKAPPTSTLSMPGSKMPAKKVKLKEDRSPKKSASAGVKASKAGSNTPRPLQRLSKPLTPPKPFAHLKPLETPRSPAVERKKIVSKPDPLKGYRIQIGAHRSEAAAKSAWDKRLKQHGTILNKLTLLVRRVDLHNRGVYYRVQAGPLNDQEAAKRICDALKQKKVGCLVIRP